MRELATLTGALLALVIAGCCAQTEQVAVHVRYRLPLKEPEDLACFRRCQKLRELGSEHHAQCLEACPGVDVTKNAACARDDVPPEAECVTVVRSEERRHHESPIAAPFILGLFIGGTTSALLVANQRTRSPEQNTGMSQ